MISQEELEAAIEGWRARKEGRTVTRSAVPQPMVSAGYVPAEEYEELPSGQVDAADDFALSQPTAEGVEAIPPEAYGAPDDQYGGFSPRGTDEPTVVPTGNPAAAYDWNDDDENR